MNWENFVGKMRLSEEYTNVGYFELPSYPNASERATGPINNIMNERLRYVYVYSILMLIVLYLVFQRAFSFFSMCLKASRRIHNSLFNGIIHAKMHFFNTNTSGRIINRFSKDIIDIDTSLPITMYDSIAVSQPHELTVIRLKI